jgi:hypothetical protein
MERVRAALVCACGAAVLFRSRALDCLACMRMTIVSMCFNRMCAPTDRPGRPTTALRRRSCHGSVIMKSIAAALWPRNVALLRCCNREFIVCI